MNVIWLNKDPNIPLIHGKSSRRRLNSWRVSVSQRFRWERVWGYPRHMILDLINVCGLKCPICPQGRCEIPRKPSQITEKLFQAILDAAGPYLYTLTLTNWGEPVQHPKLLKLLEYARKYPIYIGFSSNLQKLDDVVIDGLIDLGIDEIGCSIDGATAETYARYRVGGDFQRAMENMRRLIERRNARSARLPRVRWQVLVNRYTEKEIELIEQTAAEIGVDSLVFVPIYIDIARMFTHPPLERLDRDREWLPENPELSWYDYSTGSLKVESNFCGKLWDSIVIHPDGAVSPCCAVIDPKDDFGVIESGSDLMRVWNGTSYRAARRMVREGQSFETEIVCRHCLKHGLLTF